MPRYTAQAAKMVKHFIKATSQAILLGFLPGANETLVVCTILVWTITNLDMILLYSEAVGP